MGLVIYSGTAQNSDSLCASVIFYILQMSTSGISFNQIWKHFLKTPNHSERSQEDMPDYIVFVLWLYCLISPLCVQI